MTWFLLANVAFAIIWIFYRIFLHRDTFFLGKRVTLIIGMLFSMIYPLLNITSLIIDSKPITNLSKVFIIELPEVVITAHASSGISLENKLITAYFLVSAILIIRIFWQMGNLMILTLRSERKRLKGLKIVCLPKGSAPFSFFGLVFIQTEDHSSSDLEEILHHESVHIRQWHTLDLLLSELICAVFWINPFVWLLKYDLRENLEFLADKDVVFSGFDAKSYQYHLLRLSYQQTPIRMGNNFNVSQLKNRIAMMNKKRTPKAGLGKYVLLLPLFALLTTAAYGYKTKIDTTGQTVKKQVKFTPPVRDKVEHKLDKEKVKTVQFTPPVVKKNEQKAENGKVKKTVKFTPPVIKEEKPFEVVEQKPTFPGGDAAFNKFINDNLKYPISAAEMGIEGRVIIRFVVSKKGTITNVELIRGIDAACDKEAIRVVKLMPKWVPGKQNGRNVPVYYNLPITFKLHAK